jgi:hypothetical protein
LRYLTGGNSILQRSGNVLLPHNRAPRFGSVLSGADDKLLRHILAKMQELAGIREKYFFT